MLVLACNDNAKREDSGQAKKLNSDSYNSDSSRTFSYKQKIKDSLIVNLTNKSVDILFNGVKGFLGGQKNMVSFTTECVVCEPFQIYNNGILFAKRLYFDTEKAQYFSKNRCIMDTTNRIETLKLDGESKRKEYKFSSGNLTMNYQGQSCNDADYVKVNLQYDKGTITINKLINASFFEFDMDKNGSPEQYIYGTRNCSQEIVVLRIGDRE